MPDVEREIDELYAAPLDEFTRLRNELARRLKDDGERDAAAEVRGLAKPSLAVWAINQLARRDPKGVRRLVEAGTRMRDGQREALGGGSPEALERAAADERDAIAALAREAGAALADAGRAANSSTVDRVATTLRAAAVDEQASALLERGRLTEELEPAGFGALAGMPVAPRRPAAQTAAPREPRKPPREDPAERRRRVADAREELERARGAEREARRDAKRARAQAEAAERAAEEAAAAVHSAEEALERVRRP